MGQTDWQNFCIDLDLVAVEGWAPINILSPQHNWLLIRSVLQDGHVHRLVELEEHRRIKLDLFVVSDELKHKGFIEDGIARRRHNLSAEPTLEEADSDGDLLIGPHIDKIDEGVTAQHSATHVPLIRVEVLLC